MKSRKDILLTNESVIQSSCVVDESADPLKLNIRKNFEFEDFFHFFNKKWNCSKKISCMKYPLLAKVEQALVDCHESFTVVSYFNFCAFLLLLLLYFEFIWELEGLVQVKNFDTSRANFSSELEKTDENLLQRCVKFRTKINETKQFFALV